MFMYDCHTNEDVVKGITTHYSYTAYNVATVYDIMTLFIYLK